MNDDTPARRRAADALRGFVGAVGKDVTDAVRKELAAGRADAESHPVQRAAAAALGGVGQNVSALLRQELGAMRADVVGSARSAARGAGLLGAAAAAGNTAGLFIGVAVWQGLGSRIGYARSALVVAALSGGATAVLARAGAGELARSRARTEARRRRPRRAAPTTATEGDD